MSGFQKTIVVGNLGSDPEARHTQGGTAVTNFSVATSEKWRDKQSGETREETEWHRVVAWGKTAELCRDYLAKGSMVCVEGKLKTSKWEKNGVTHYTTELHADRVTFLGKRGDGQQQNAAPQQQSGHGGYGQPAGSASWGNGDDNLPF